MGGWVENITVNSGSLLNHFFTQAVWRELLLNGNHKLYDGIVRRYISPCCRVRTLTNREIMDKIGALLRHKYRNEYYYRNALLQHYCMWQNRPKKNVMALSQMKISDSRADFVFVNGEGVVYEIKTEQDNFLRLESQILDYYKAFEYVNVVVGESRLGDLRDKLNRTPVGIIRIDKGGNLIEEKKAVRHSDWLDPNVIFGMLRRVERDYVLKSFYGYLPYAPVCRYVRKSRELFGSIPIRKLLELTRKALKMRNCHDSAYYMGVPEIMHALLYFWNNEACTSGQIDRFLSHRYRPVSERSIKNELDILPIF